MLDTGTSDILFYQDNQATARTAVVVLHGLFGSCANFTSLAKSLDPYFRVLRMDLRNHGKSFHSDTINYPLMAADVLRTLDTLGIDQCILLGHSMGGKVAMQIAAVAPMRVSALIVVDIAPKVYPISTHNDVLQALSQLPVTELKSRAEADALLAKQLDDTMLRQFLLTNLQRAETGFQWRINLAAIISGYGAIAAAPELPLCYNRPTLFVCGALSNYVVDSDWALISKHFTDAQRVIIAGAGHWLHAEAPALFWRELATFIGVDAEPKAGY